MVRTNAGVAIAPTPGLAHQQVRVLRGHLYDRIVALLQLLIQHGK